MKRVLTVLVVACLPVAHCGCGNVKTPESGSAVDNGLENSAPGNEGQEESKDEEASRMEEPPLGPDGQEMDQNPAPTASDGQEGSEGNDKKGDHKEEGGE